MTDFVKQHPRSPEGFFGWEAAGLRWLSSVDGGVPCARVLAVDATSLTLRRLQSVPAGRDAAHEFGRRLRLGPMAAIGAVAARCRAGDFDDDDGPARLHGDLWSGNVMWTPDGVVLIDPAAHGGHHETDLAMLALFGCPHYDAVLAGYQQVRALKPGWRNRIGLHQLYPLLAHVVLFGGGYAGQTDAAARAALAA